MGRPIHLQSVVFILAGNSEIDAHMWSEIGNLICLRHWLRSTAVENLKLFPKYVFSSKRAERVLSYHLIQVPELLVI